MRIHSTSLLLAGLTAGALLALSCTPAQAGFNPGVNATGSGAWVSDPANLNDGGDGGLDLGLILDAAGSEGILPGSGVGNTSNDPRGNRPRLPGWRPGDGGRDIPDILLPPVDEEPIWVGTGTGNNPRDVDVSLGGGVDGRFGESDIEGLDRGRIGRTRGQGGPPTGGGQTGNPTNPVPEPASLALALAGLGGLAVISLGQRFLGRG